MFSYLPSKNNYKKDVNVSKIISLFLKIESIASSIKEIFTSEYSSLNMKMYIPVRRDEFVGTMVS